MFFRIRTDKKKTLICFLAQGIKSHFEGGHGHHEEEHVDIEAILRRQPGTQTDIAEEWTKTVAGGRPIRAE